MVLKKNMDEWKLLAALRKARKMSKIRPKGLLKLKVKALRKEICKCLSIKPEPFNVSNFVK